MDAPALHSLTWSTTPGLVPLRGGIASGTSTTSTASPRSARNPWPLRAGYSLASAGMPWTLAPSMPLNCNAARVGLPLRPGKNKPSTEFPVHKPQAADLGLCSATVARGGGLEPPITGPEPVVLPITPPPNGAATMLADPRFATGEPGVGPFCRTVWGRRRSPAPCADWACR